jgi:hypothetical protein
MKTLVLIMILAMFTDTAFAIEDTVENRNMEAEHYLSVNPPKEMLQDVAKQVALNYPPEKREIFIKIITQYYDVGAVTKSVKETMAKVFTADELAAMAEFYGSPVGMSAMKKLGAYLAEIMPTIQAETLKAVAKANREIVEPKEKDENEPLN